MNDPRRPTPAAAASPAPRCDAAAAHDSCRWVRIQLPRFLDGELPDDLGSRVGVHLGRCDDCSDELAALQDELCGVIDHLVGAEPPEGALARLRARLHDELAPAATPATTIPPAVAPRALVDRGAPRRRFVAHLRSFGPGLAAAALLAGILWGWPEETARGLPATARAPRPAPQPAQIASNLDAPAPARAEAPERASPSAELASVRSAEGEPLFAGGIECITFEEAIDAVVVGPLSWGRHLPGTGLASPAARAALLVRRGDIDGNGRFEWKDLHGLFGYLRDGREGETDPACLAAADFDGDGAVTVHDSLIAAQALARTAEWTADAPEVFAYESDNPLPCRPVCP